MTLKKLLPVCTVFLFTALSACSSYSVKKGQAQGDDEVLKSRFTKYQLYFYELSERELLYNVNFIENSIRNNGDLSSEQRMSAISSMKENLKWEDYHYFTFNINHGTAWGFNKDDFIFNITDADGKAINATATPISYMITGDGTFYVHRWIIKTGIPIIKANVKSPVTIKIQLFKNYTVSYLITPGK